MTRDRRVADLIARWQPRLGLQAWDIRYIDEPMPEGTEDAASAINFADAARVAQVWIMPELPDTQLEAAVVHELLHLNFSDLMDTALSVAGLGGEGATVLMDKLDGDEECLIHTLALALTGQRLIAPSAAESRKMSAWR